MANLTINANGINKIETAKFATKPEFQSKQPETTKSAKEFSKGTNALYSYFMGGQSVTFGGTSGFKIKKLEDVPCPCCGQIMLTPSSTEKHVNRLKMAKGNKLADRIKNEEAKFLRSNERCAAFIIADAAKNTELNLSGAVTKANKNLPERFNTYCQDVLLHTALLCEEQSGENSPAYNYLMEKAENVSDHESFYRPNITEEFSQFKSSMTEEQYNKLEDELLTLPLDYKNVSRFMTEAQGKGTVTIANNLYAPALATAEHVHPHSLGGSNKASNFLSECAGCNNPRSSLSYVEWFKVHPEFKRNAQEYIEHVESRIVNGELPTTYDSYPVDIRETLTSESEGHIVLRVLDKEKLVELREAKKQGIEPDIHAETEKANKEEENEN